MKESLLESIYKQERELEGSLPVVTLELFFEGNDDVGSIGCNLLNHPGVEKFYSTLKQIRDKSNVQNVLVEIMEYDEGDDIWPFSERVYILANAQIDEVADWVKELEICDISAGYMYGQPKSAPELNEGYSVYSIWWD